MNAHLPISFFENSLLPAVVLTLIVLPIGSIIFLRFASISTTVESKTAPPYSSFGHPKKSLLDILLGYVVEAFVPFGQLCACSHKTGNYKNGGEESSLETIQKVRGRMISLEQNFMHWPACFLWNRSISKRDKTDFLVGGTVMIPRHSTILSEWGLSSSKTNPASPFDDEWPVEVEITCPRSLINGNIEFKGSGLGYKQFKMCKLEDLKLSTAVPIVLYFHGGGFAVGSPRDAMPFFINSLVNQRERAKKGEKRDGAATGLILASVKYRLCPENPFPAAVIDCLSSVKFFIETFPLSNIHIAGFSAGANLAAVVGFETVRQYPGKLKSVVILHPTLLPRLNTTSIHMNSLSSKCCPVDFLTWCWAAYLQVGDCDLVDKKSYTAALVHHELYQLGGIGSINPMLRLCYPQVDLPNELKSDLAPKIFVHVASADPLYDDGIDLVESLEAQNIPVKLFENFGSHGLAGTMDLFLGKNDFIEAWCESIWP